MDDITTQGLGNYLDERSKRIYEAHAFCTYQSCVSRHFIELEQKGETGCEYTKQYGVRKNVKKSAIDCPDCGNALIWRPIKFDTFVYDYRTDLS